MRFQKLLYLASLTLFYDSFPANKIGLGDTTKPLSLIFILLFFIFNFDNIIKIKWRKIEVFTLIFFLTTIAVSFFRVYSDGFYLFNAKKFLNEIIIMILIYLSFRLYFSKINKEELTKTFKYALYGYSINNLFGVLQFIYIYILKSSSILTINKILLNSTAHLEKGRIQFLFGEPSFISQHIILIILPIVIYFKYNNVKISRYLKVSLLIMFCMTIFSKSIKSILDFIIFLAIYIIIYRKFKVTKKMIISTIFVFFLSILSFMIINPNKILSQNIVLKRIDSIVSSIGNWSNYTNKDGSLVARLNYSLVGFYSIKDFPILGYGGTHYIKAYKNNLEKIDPLFYTNTELLRNFIQVDTLNSINMYSRVTCEFGLLGIIWSLAFINRIWHFTKRNKFERMIVFINLYNIIQMDSLISIPLLLWCAFIIANKKQIKLL